MSALLEVSDLSITFPTDEGPVRAVDGVSLAMDEGEVLGLVGESGSGKSVTARALMRLDEGAQVGPTSRIALHADGEAVDVLALRGPRALRRVRGDLVSMIFQEPMASFAPAITVGAQMVEQIRLHRGGTRAEAREAAAAMLERVGLPDAARAMGAHAFQLSGGQRQRAMIAMALSTRPRLLIADEPTTALDVTIQAQVLRLMRDLRDEMGMGVLLITHDLGVVAQTADRVAVMYLGRIMELGPVREVIRRPAHPYTRGLLAALPRLDALDRPLTPVPGDIPGPLERPSGCPFRTRCPHAIPGRCDREPPAAVAVGPGHLAACVLAGEMAGAA